MRKKLEFKADRIEDVLSLHNVPARVTGGTVTPKWIRFTVLPAVGAKISKIKKLSNELATSLDVAECRVSRRGATVAIEIPRNDPQPVRLLPLYNQLTDQSSIPPVTAILGLAEDGAPLLIRLPSPDVGHILVTGVKGAGKTTLLKAMILSLAIEDVPPKSQETVLMLLAGCELGGFVDLPHLVHPPAIEIPDMLETLRSLAGLLKQRLRLGEESPRIVLFIDDIDSLISVDPKGVGRDLTKITSRGREVGIHVVAATERTEVASLAPGFPVRIVGHVDSAADARDASRTTGTGAERLLGKGDFIAVAEGKCQYFQAAHVSPTEIYEVVERLNSDTWRVVEDTSDPSRLRSLPWPVSQLTGMTKRNT